MTDVPCPWDIATMLWIWRNSVAVMHIAHHKSASKLSRNNRLLGSSAAILGAAVGVGILSQSDTGNLDSSLVILAGVLSLLAAALAALNTFLDYEARAQRHHTAASGFGSVRREIEELIAISDHEKSSLDQVRMHWNTVLKSAPPLAKSIHDSVKSNPKAWDEMDLLPERPVG